MCAAESPSLSSATRRIAGFAVRPGLFRVPGATPVPGGVGPMTIAMLMKNTLDAAEKHGR